MCPHSLGQGLRSHLAMRLEHEVAGAGIQMVLKKRDRVPMSFHHLGVPGSQREKSNLKP